MATNPKYRPMSADSLAERLRFLPDRLPDASDVVVPCTLLRAAADRLDAQDAAIAAWCEVYRRTSGAFTGGSVAHSEAADEFDAACAALAALDPKGAPDA